MGVSFVGELHAGTARTVISANTKKTFLIFINPSGLIFDNYNRHIEITCSKHTHTHILPSYSQKIKRLVFPVPRFRNQILKTSLSPFMNNKEQFLSVYECGKADRYLLRRDCRRSVEKHTDLLCAESQFKVPCSVFCRSYSPNTSCLLSEKTVPSLSPTILRVITSPGSILFRPVSK